MRVRGNDWFISCAVLLLTACTASPEVGLRGLGSDTHFPQNLSLRLTSGDRALPLSTDAETTDSIPYSLLEVSAEQGFPIDEIAALIGGPFVKLASALGELVSPSRGLTTVSTAVSGVSAFARDRHTGLVLAQATKFSRAIVSLGLSIAAVNPLGIASAALLLLSRGTALALGISHYFNLARGNALQEEMCNTGAPLAMSRSSLLWMQSELNGVLEELDGKSAIVPPSDSSTVEERAERLKNAISARLTALAAKASEWQNTFSKAVSDWQAGIDKTGVPPVLITTLEYINMATAWVGKHILSVLENLWDEVSGMGKVKKAFQWKKGSSETDGGTFEMEVEEDADRETTTGRALRLGEQGLHAGVASSETDPSSEAEVYKEAAARLSDTLKLGLKIAQNPTTTPFFMDFDLESFNRFGFATLYEFEDDGVRVRDKYTGPFMMHAASGPKVEDAKKVRAMESGWRFRTLPEMRENRLSLYDTRIVHARDGAIAMCMEQAWLGTQDVWKTSADGHKMSLEKFVNSNQGWTWAGRSVLYTLEPSWDMMEMIGKEDHLRAEAQRLQFGTPDNHESSPMRCISIRIAVALPNPRKAGEALASGIEPSGKSAKSSRTMPAPQDRSAYNEDIPSEHLAFAEFGPRRIQLCTNNELEAVAWYCTAARIGSNMPMLEPKKAHALSGLNRAFFFALGRPLPPAHKTELQSLAGNIQLGDFFSEPGSKAGGMLESICTGDRFTALLNDVNKPSSSGTSGVKPPPPPAAAGAGGAAAGSPIPRDRRAAAAPPAAAGGAAAGGAAAGGAAAGGAAAGGAAAGGAVKEWAIAKLFSRPPKGVGDWTPQELKLMEKTLPAEAQADIDLHEELKKIKSLANPQPIPKGAAPTSSGGAPAGTLAPSQAAAPVAPVGDLFKVDVEDIVPKQGSEEAIAAMRREMGVAIDWSKADTTPASATDDILDDTVKDGAAFGLVARTSAVSPTRVQSIDDSSAGPRGGSIDDSAPQGRPIDDTAPQGGLIDDTSPSHYGHHSAALRTLR